jgi:hypothetical protein
MPIAARSPPVAEGIQSPVAQDASRQDSLRSSKLFQEVALDMVPAESIGNRINPVHEASRPMFTRVLDRDSCLFRIQIPGSFHVAILLVAHGGAFFISRYESMKGILSCTDHTWIKKS